jgi:hypothetical protein
MKPGDIGFRIVYEEPTIVATYTLLRETSNGWRTWCRRGAGPSDDGIIKDQSMAIVHLTTRFAVLAEIGYLARRIGEGANGFGAAKDAEIFRAARKLCVLTAMLPTLPIDVLRSRGQDG